MIYQAKKVWTHDLWRVTAGESKERSNKTIGILVFLCDRDGAHKEEVDRVVFSDFKVGGHIRNFRVVKARCMDVVSNGRA